MWYIFYLERKQADHFNVIEIPWGTGSIKIVPKIKYFISRSEAYAVHAIFPIFSMQRIMLAAGSDSPALPALVSYREKERYKSGQSVHSWIHGFGLLLSVPSSEAWSGTAAWNFLSGKADVIHT